MTNEKAIEELKEIKSAYSNKQQFHEACLMRSEHKALDMAIKALEQEPKTGHWIPVSEKLPEEYSNVLLTINGCKGLKVRSGMYYKGGSFHSDTGEFWESTDKELIAWMPLPTPYEPQESEV